MTWSWLALVASALGVAAIVGAAAAIVVAGIKHGPLTAEEVKIKAGERLSATKLYKHAAAIADTIVSAIYGELKLLKAKDGHKSFDAEKEWIQPGYVFLCRALAATGSPIELETFGAILSIMGEY